ncbi:MAG: Nif3-like dinuclear metal center hexameric protein, partial [Myxococcota bacterium]
MNIERDTLFAWIDETLETNLYKDYSPIGLQVEGAPTITKIALGVSAHLELIEKAAAWGAEALLVHHGFFWRGEPQVFRGWRKRRLKALLMHDISLGSYHLPLDGHPTLGNNAVLCDMLGVPRDARTPFAGRPPIGIVGRYPEPRPVSALLEIVRSQIRPDPLVFQHGPAEVDTIAVVTGGGAGYYEEARDQHGAQLFLTGEPREPTMAEARETETHFVAAGHYDTETVGIKAL